jgi:hypothetical protein
LGDERSDDREQKAEAESGEEASRNRHLDLQQAGCLWSAATDEREPGGPAAGSLGKVRGKKPEAGDEKTETAMIRQEGGIIAVCCLQRFHPVC